MAGALNNSIVVRTTRPVAAVGSESYTMLRQASFMDAVVFATNGGGEGVNIQRNNANITAILTPGGDTNLVRPAGAGAAVAAQKTLVPGDVLSTNTAVGNLAYEAYIWLSAPGVAG